MASPPPIRFKLRLSAATQKYLIVSVTATATSTANTPILTLGDNGKALAYLNVTAVGFTPTSYSWKWVPNPLNSFSITPTANNPFGTAGKQTKLTLVQEGIYQFVVTATDGANSATKNTWVNVWSNKPAYNTDGSVGNFPGINPPESVRVLAPDPGPFNHPRLIFTASDWPELSAKQQTSSQVKQAISYMQQTRASVLDFPGTQMNLLATYFYAYSVGGYLASDYKTIKTLYKTLSLVSGDSNMLIDLLLGKIPGVRIYDALACACYYEWLQFDPTKSISAATATQQATFTYLAAVIAGAAQFELLYNGPAGFLVAQNGKDGTFFNSRFNLVFCYDVAYNWMTSAQQLVVRSYLYAIGYGVYNNCKGGVQTTAPYVLSGSNQNGGDFANLNDGMNLAAMAIEGEESTVPATVRKSFQTYSAPVTTAWPNASAASVSNLHRQIRHNSEWNLTRWGFVMNMVAYFQLGQNFSLLAGLAFARRWEDQFVTTNVYQSCLATLYNLCQREVDAVQGNTVYDIFDHHDSSSLLPGAKVIGAIFYCKYMYPDDAAIDYYYRVLKNVTPDASNYPLGQAIFATDLFVASLSAMADAKGLGTFKYDPLRSTCITRSGWGDTDMMVQFENRWDIDGHMHTEKNNFCLYALGRAWSNPPGYHVAISDSQASILIQIDAHKADKATLGYIGQSPSSATETTKHSDFPPVIGKFIEYVQDPAELWTYGCGDAATAYNFAHTSGGTDTVDTGIANVSLTKPGLSGAFLNEDLSDFTTGNLTVSYTGYNTVYNAKRTVFTVLDRAGVHPYVLVLDDFCKDGTARNYRWTMPNCISFGTGGDRFTDASGATTYSSLAMLGTATSTQAVLYHDPIDKATTTGQAGLPRLLVRDVANIRGNKSQPVIFIDDRPVGFSGGNLTYGYDNNQKQFSSIASRRLMIQRSAVVQPGYQVLLYPFYSTATNALPTTTWSSATILKIAHVNGVVDTITFAAQAAIPASGAARITALKAVQTRIIGFTRANGKQALPTVTVPPTTTVTCNSHNAQGLPTYVCKFAISAKDAKGKALAFSSNGATGSSIPVGVQRVFVSAVDAYGQQVTNSFVALVQPSAPSVILTRAVNLGKPYSATLVWSYWPGVTGYYVKRSTKSSGPYTTIATLSSYTTTYTDSTMPSATTYYVVSARFVDSTYKVNFESVNSTPLSTAPAANGAVIGSSTIGGVIVRGSSTGSADYLLSASNSVLGAGGTTGTFASASVSGNGVYIARAKTYSSTTNYGAFGIDYRATSNQKSVSAFVGFNFATTPYVYFYARTTTLGPGAEVTRYQSATLSGAATFPLYFKLVRTGGMFFAYWSQDGSVYSSLGTVRISTMPTTATVGLYLEAAKSAAVDFDVTSFLD
eukprot:TRINITY_DN29841_c0_g1_i1.p1 TRINITY_DN29841_c0_g1~~TRINITY_DN29841_c0_g1_i1.p1  ORF type:complete len:1377 (+),score=145.73 TRINITY_DN29841_c0_g1_i1:539-4669(+)